MAVTTGVVVPDPLVAVVHPRNLCVVVANWVSDQLRFLGDRPKVDNHLTWDHQEGIRTVMMVDNHARNLKNIEMTKQGGEWA